jgi:5-methylcytosine-specific restriction endonuclease McrA
MASKRPRLTTLKPRLATLKSGLRTLTTRDTLRWSGRKRQEWAAKVLHREPLCRPCDKAGRVSASVHAEHILPLEFGGTYADDNGQGICEDCHKAKSACETRMRMAGGWMAAPCTCGQHG